MDRNTVIGFVLLAVLLFLYLFLSTKGTKEIEAQKQAQADSLAVVKARQDSMRALKDSVVFSAPPDSTKQGFERGRYGQEQLVTVENDVMKVIFTSKGGQPKSVTLKKIYFLQRRGGSAAEYAF